MCRLWRQIQIRPLRGHLARKPPPQGEVPNAVRRKGAEGCTQTFCLPAFKAAKPCSDFRRTRFSCGVGPFSLASLDTSPRGGAFFWFQHRLFFSGFRLCPTRATARVAPTAVFRDVCRGDPCGRPILPLSDLVQNGPGDPAPTGEVISKSE